jgi:Ca-activated chloride channel family protein
MLLTELSHYWWMGVVAIIIALGILAVSKRKIAKQKLPLFINNVNTKSNKNLLHIKAVLIIAGLGFLVFALWRPQWGQDMQKTQTKGLDVVFTVDVSKSMNALDFSKKGEYVSRLDATKFLVENFVSGRSGDRVGLVEFAGEGFVASPLTLDHTVFLSFLGNISSDDLGKQGTNLAEAIDMSIARLDIQSEGDEVGGKAIILFSDGDETITSDAKQMAQMAKERGIKIFTVGIGSQKGSPIPVGQDAFGNIQYKQYKGETVLSALNPQPLKEIAEITGGEYFHAQDVGDLKQLTKQLNDLPTKIIDEENITPYKERYFVFALLGTILFILGFVLPENIRIKN